MLRVSPHHENLLTTIRKQERDIAWHKYQKSIAPSGHRAQCMDLACLTKATPKFLGKLRIKLNKQHKQKSFLEKEVLNIRQQKNSIKSRVSNTTEIVPD